MKIKAYFAIFLSLLSAMMTFGQSVSMVADLNATRTSFEEPQELFVFKNKLYYQMGDDSTTYAFDGINPATVAFTINDQASVTVLPDGVYICSGYKNRSTIWKFDGENTPVKILDIALTANGYIPWNLTWYNNNLYYTITRDPYEILWKYDMVDPPQIVDSIRLGGSVPEDKKLLIFNNLLCFIGADKNIYTCDGTHHAVISQNAGSASGRLLMVFNNKLCYQSTDSIGGNVMVEYDGINPPEILMNLERNRDIVNYIVYKNKLYFGVSDYWYDKHLWVYDGINPPVVRDDIFTGVPDNLGIFSNKLFLTIGGEVWTYDGESAEKIDNGTKGHIWTNIVFQDKLYYGTHVSHGGSSFWVNDGVNPPEKAWLGGSNGSNPAGKIVFKNKMYFAANEDNLGYDLWEYDGSKPEMRADINNDYPFKIIPSNNILFLVSPYKIWAYDGIHPVIEKDMKPYVDVDLAYTYNDRLYFFLHAGPDSLMSFDGTNDPVSLATNLPFHYAQEIIAYHNKIYFIASDSLFGSELRVVNEDNSASLVTDFRPGKLDSYPGNLTLFHDKLYFSARDESDNTCLWVYDGISPPEKTNFNTASPMNSIEGLAVFNDNIYSLVDQKQIWSYNEINGSALIKDNLPVVYFGYPHFFRIIENKLYFLLEDNQLGNRLWEYDGLHQPEPVTKTDLTNFGNITSLKKRLYFTAYDFGSVIWEYDGFNSPAKLHDKTLANLNLYDYADLLPYNNKLYFTAHSPVFGEELFVYTLPDSTLNLRECDSYNFNGKTLTSSGTYYDTIPGKTGNDSIVQLNLQIIHPTQSALSIRACNSFVSPDGKYLWTSTGIYTDTIPNSAGCDSVITLNLFVDHVDTSVVQDHSVLISNDGDASHVWIDCDNGNVPISGETGLTFTAHKNGHYAVIVSNGVCVDTSAVYEVLATGINDPAGGRVTLYPNPTNGNFTIDLGKICPEAQVTIAQYEGKIIRKESVKNSRIVEMKLDEPPGVYMVTLKGEGMDKTFRVVKK